MGKGAPKEVSARKPVSALREVIKVEKPVRIDPRFSDMSGSFNNGLFEASYDFLNGMREKEERSLKSKLKRLRGAKREAAVEKKRNAAAELTGLKQFKSERRQLEMKQKVKRALRKREQQAVTEGKKPFFLKRSARKEAVLKEKYQDLSRSGKVDQFMTKQRRKQAMKEASSLPGLSTFASKKS
eukprot:Hpha_TRINITY_DN1799_c0_g1::TRINITY_DN1799_c0_g1_i1::g.158350::m.158350/K14795/RRP36; ribosomal RNA-processing protein 36